VFLPGAYSESGTPITCSLWLPIFPCPYVRLETSELEASAVIPLPQLLERRSDELPFGPFDAQHRGRLVGDREPREGPLVVLTVLAHTAVVEVDGRRHLARLQDLEVAGEELSWGPRPQTASWAATSSAKGRQHAAGRWRKAVGRSAESMSTPND
jgi:hypothetical protein